LYPTCWNTKIIDEIIRVSHVDAGKTARDWRRKRDPGGISSGAALWAALAIARRPESAEKSLSRFF
jgi:cysteine synthase A